MAERELKVRFTGDTSGLTRSLSGAEKATKSAGDKIATAGKAMAAGFAVAGAAGFAFATKSVNTYKTVGGEVAKLKRFTGDSTQGASRLRAAFKLTGIDTEKAGKALGLFSKNLVAGKLDGFNKSLTGNRTQAKKVQKAMEDLADAQKDYQDVQKDGKSNAADLQKSLEKVSDAQGKLTDLTKGAGNALGSLGFKTRDAQGHLLPMSELLPKVADVFKNMPDGAEKTALAMDLFGKAGADMLPFLNKGADGIAELEEQADKLGVTLNDKDLDAIKESKKQSRLWSLAMEGLQIQIGRYVLPVLNDLMAWVNEKGIPGLHAIAKKIADEVEPKLKALGEWWDTDGKKMWNDFIDWVNQTLLPLLGTLGKAIGEKVLDTLEAMVKWGKDNPDWAGPVVAGFLTIIAMIKATSLAFVTTPWGAFLTALLTLGIALFTAYQSNEDFRAAVDETARDLQEHWKTISDSFMNDFIGPMRTGLAYLKTDWDAIWYTVSATVRLLQAAWQGLAQTWHDTVFGITGQIAILQSWWSALTVAFQWMVGVLDSLWNGFTLHFGDGVIKITGLCDILKVAWAALIAPFQLMVQVLTVMWNGFTIHFGDGVLKIQGLSGLLKITWSGLVAAFQFVVKVLDSLWNGFTLHFGDGVLRIGGAVDLLKGIWTGAGAVIGGVIRTLTGWMDTLISWADTALGKLRQLRDFADKITPSIPSWVPVIGGNAFVPVPAPPALAAGGIIPGSPWGTLVRAGENNRSEAIVPLSKMPAGGNTYNITVDVAPGADPVRAGSAVVDAIRSYERANGQGWRTAPV